MAKEYKYHTKKTFEEMDDNAKTLTGIRADQESERLLGMRPDMARAEYCLLLGRLLQDKATKLIKNLSKGKEQTNQTKSDYDPLDPTRRNNIWED